MRKKRQKITLSILLAAGLFAGELPLNHPYLSYEGLWFAQTDSNQVLFDRHLESVLTHPESGISATSKPFAYTQTGVRIRFKTASPRISLEFEARPGGGFLGTDNAFAVYCDSMQIAVFDELQFAFQSPDSNRSHEYNIVLPSLWPVNLTAFALRDGYELEELSADSRPRYVAIGNSIAHGTGHQSASFHTYPYVLADLQGWHLTNLAVAGARMGWPIATEFKDKEADFITIHLGFNDWSWDNKPLGEKEAMYHKLLDTLRYYQPHAFIFCLTPIYTTHTQSNMNCPFTLDELRQVIDRAVMQRQRSGDDKLFAILGPHISDGSMLMDGVHLSADGAGRFAENLSVAIDSIMMDTALEPKAPQPKNFRLLSAFPNPFNDQVAIRLEITDAHSISMVIYSISGQEIMRRQEHFDAAGIYTLHLSLEQKRVASGIYIVQLSSGQLSQSQKIVFLK